MQAVSAIATLEGEWRVAGIDGEPFDEPYGAALRGNASDVWWEPPCAGLVRTYRIDGAAVAFGPRLPASPPPGPDAAPPAVCAIGVPAAMQEVFRALDVATALRRTPENGILVSGGGRSVLLFSQ
ncbi:hypothetical protein [Tsuneonella sp. SYSU-LHT278]|uniref:hypothetical protein n=1 Tax=Tsuneonella sediminis TaxID=3416089 RepID=UPI003F7AD6D8